MSSTSTDVAEDADKVSPLNSLPMSRENLIVAGIVAGQALVLGLVMFPGWYSAADLPNIAYATRRPLDWEYLSSTLGGHFGAAQRTVYWILNRVAPFEWWLTVLIRLAFQALATVLLWKLFRALVGTRPWLWAVLLFYAVSTYLVPGTAALNSGLGLTISQACLVGALLAHVRYSRERRLVDAGVVAVLALVMLAFAQGSLPMLVILPVLSFFFVEQGSWRQRLRGELRRWRGWLLLAVALLAFAALYLSGDYNSPYSDFTAADALWLAGQGWFVILGPALVGGPWQFVAHPLQWSAYAEPPLMALVLGQVALVGLIVLSVRRTGKLALVAWAIPVWTAVAGLVLTGLGRWGWLAEVIPTILRYSYFVPVGLALGIVLAFAAKPTTDPFPGFGRRALGRERARALMIGAVCLVTAASLVSTFRFAVVFWDNPAAGFTKTLLEEVAERGPEVQIFDTSLPEHVVPYVSQMYVSELLALGGATAQFGGPSTDRLFVGNDGRLVPGRFYKVSDFETPREDKCGIHVSGEGTTRIPLRPVSGDKVWFLQLELFQPRNNRVTMRVLDEDGQELAIQGDGPTLDATGEVVMLHRRLAWGRPATIEIEALDPETNFCLVHTYLGVPVP